MSRPAPPASSVADPDADPGTGAGRRVLRVLLSFLTSEPQVTAEEVAAHVRMPLSSCYRYLAVLKEFGLLEDNGRGGYAVGPNVVRLARTARAGSSLTGCAAPHMRRLAAECNETIILLRRSGTLAICIERVESTQPIRTTFEVGTALPLHRGAGPKLLLAYAGPAQEALIAETERRGDLRPVERDALQLELSRIHAQGWSDSRAEITPDIYAVAAPVRSHDQVTALSVVAPRYRVSRSDQARLRRLVIAAAAAISEELTERAL